MQWAAATGRIHANSELVLGDELGSSRGYVMPLPQGEAGDDDDLDDSPLADLKRDLATLAGKMVIVETTSAAAGPRARKRHHIATSNKNESGQSRHRFSKRSGVNLSSKVLASLRHPARTGASLAGQFSATGAAALDRRRSRVNG